MYSVASLDSSHHRNFYLDINSDQKSDSTIILLHGFPDDAFGWDLQIKALKTNYNLIAPFLPGTLNGNKVNSKDLELSHIHTLVKELIVNCQNQKQKIYIVAHDLGCFLGSALARDPDLQISGLIIINGLDLFQYIQRKTSPTQWMKSFYILLAQSNFVRHFVSQAAPKCFLKIIFNLGKVPSNDALRKYNQNLLNPILIYKKLFIEAIRILKNDKHTKIPTPTLFLWGKDDAFLNIPTRSEVNQFFESSKIRLLSGGHWIHKSSSSEVNRIINNTLQEWRGYHESV